MDDAGVVLCVYFLNKSPEETKTDNEFILLSGRANAAVRLRVFKSILKDKIKYSPTDKLMHTSNK